MRLPLNSTCITAGQLRRLGLVLGISVSSSINNQRLMVEGKLSDDGHDSCNVQVVFVEYLSEAVFVLWDEDGEFLTPPVAVSTAKAVPEITEHEHSGEPDDMERLHQTVADITTKWDSLQV